MAYFNDSSDKRESNADSRNGLDHDIDKSGSSDEDDFGDSFSVHPTAEDSGSSKGMGSTNIVQGESTSHDASMSSRSLFSESILPSFVVASLERKASFKELKYWIALSLTLDGRDKITKVLQYTSRLLGWWFLTNARTHGSKKFRGHGKRFTSLYKSLGKSRKAFRLGRSINEIHKISSMGLLGLFFWHLKQQYLEDRVKTTDRDNDEYSDDPSGSCSGGNNSTLSSSSVQVASTTNSLNMGRISYQIRSIVSASLGAVFPSNEDSRVVWWKVIGTALKTFGMLGYWLGDNANFLASSGVLDNYNVSEKDRVVRRKHWQEFTSKKANQFYFFATIIGLATNSYSYFLFQSNQESFSERDERDKGKILQKSQVILSKDEQRKQFSLLLAVLKSSMDVIVFSNNPGIDLYQKFRGRKNHEVIHCLCGLISAGTSLYTNFPDANK